MRGLLLSALVVMGVLIACGGSESAADDLQAALQELSGEISRIIGEAVCERTEQCRVIAMGRKPCGGPWSYRPYSIHNTDVPLLEATVSRYDSVQEELNQRTGAMSDCLFVTEPAVQCLSGRCIAQ